MTLLTRVLPALLALFSTPAVAQTPVPELNSVRLSSLSHRGNGCRSGSVSANIAPDATAFTLLFSEFQVDSGERVGRPVRKVCQITVTLDVPEGWSFAVFGLDVRGYASLQQGVIGVQKVHFGFPGERAQLLARHQVAGPFDGNFETHSRANLSLASWSKCRGGSLKTFQLAAAAVVRPQLGGFSDEDGDADNRSGHFPQGLVTVDSLDGSLHQRYGVAWQRCH